MKKIKTSNNSLLLKFLNWYEFQFLTEFTYQFKIYIQLAYDPATVAVWECVRSVYQLGCKVVFIWIPGHIDIDGNEKADAAAKEASIAPESTDRLPVRMEDLKCQIRNDTWDRWQDQWSVTRSKLGLIKRSVRPWSSECDLSRKDQLCYAANSSTSIPEWYVSTELE